MTIRDLPEPEPGDRRTLTVNLAALPDALPADAADTEARRLFDGVAELLRRRGYPLGEVRLTTGDGLRLDVSLDPDPMGEKVLVVGENAKELLEGLDNALDTPADDGPRPVDPELTAGADSPLTSPAGDELLGEQGYATMRGVVLQVAGLLGRFEPDLFDKLIATCERSVGPGLDQAVAEGVVPLDKLGAMRDALDLELRLFRLARTFRQGIASVQGEVRRHVAAAEQQAGAPPAIEVIRRNARQNGGGT